VMAARRRAIDWSVNDYPESVAEVTRASTRRPSMPVARPTMSLVQEAFAVIIVVVLVVGVAAALAAAFTSKDVYGQVGHGAFSLRDGTDRPVRESSGAMAAGQREDEIRQMLEARNARRVARGQEP